MPSAHPTMDGGNSFPQHQQPGDALHSIPGLHSQLAVPDMEVRPCRSWGGGGCAQEGSGQSSLAWEILGVLVCVYSSDFQISSCAGLVGGVEVEVRREKQSCD